MNLLKIARKLNAHLIKAAGTEWIRKMDSLYSAFLNADEESRIDICRDLGFVLEKVKAGIRNGELKAPGLYSRFENIMTEISEYCWDAGIEIPILPSREIMRRIPFGRNSGIRYPIGGGPSEAMPNYQESWNPLKWPAESKRRKEIDDDYTQREMAARDVWENKNRV